MSYALARATVAEVFDAPGFAALVEQYEAEAGRNPDLAGSPPDRERYLALEGIGMIACVAAMCDGVLIGVCALLITPLTHYQSRVIATVESIFLLDEHRKGGAGLELLRVAKEIALEAGAAGVYISAPKGGRLERILPRIGFTATNTIFYSKA